MDKPILQMPAFDQVANMLVAESVMDVSPAELHGHITGHVAAGARMKPANLQGIACELLDIAALADSGSAGLLQHLYLASCGQLEGTDLDFTLLLPNDDDDIEQRAEMLGCWCQGFLSGFGLYGKHTEESLSTEAKETLHDLANIAQISLDLEGTEEEESDLMEIEEYVRMVVLMLFTECNQALVKQAQALADAQPGKGRLH
ncbi:UPF0149 family protein [Pontibacter sp. JAM-7]|uniref:UPF0149 family protein n=1 Tax=Pontibacter sp. JAM-7 TaxID=3366581 RepID=UPI003AF6AED7